MAVLIAMIGVFIVPVSTIELPNEMSISSVLTSGGSILTAGDSKASQPFSDRASENSNFLFKEF